jgi:anti-anti-sigma factor
MIVAHRLNTTGYILSRRADHHLTADRGGVDMRAQLRHLATILTISGDIDARNIDRVSAYATRLVPVGNALLLDLSGVTFFAAQSISVLVTVGDACDNAGSPWALITSHAVDRVLRISEHDDVLPVASSVPDGIQYFADLASVRQQVPSFAKLPSAPGVRSIQLEPSSNPRRSQPSAVVLGRSPPITPIMPVKTGPGPASRLCMGYPPRHDRDPLPTVDTAQHVRPVDPSPLPDSPVTSDLPSRLDQPADPTDVDLADISQPTSRLPQR